MTPSTLDPSALVELIDHYDGACEVWSSLSEAQRRASEIDSRPLEWDKIGDDEWLAYLENGDVVRFTVYL